MNTRPDIGSAKPSDGHSTGAQKGFISLAVLAGLILVPFVVAVGLLTDGGSPFGIPFDIAAAPLRGTLEVTPSFRTALPALVLSPRRVAN